MTTLEIPTRYEQLQYRAAPVVDVDDKSGEIYFMAAPYEAETELERGLFEVFTRHSLKRAVNAPSRFKLFHPHDGPLIGVARKLESRRDGLYVTGRFSSTQPAQDARTLAQEKILDSASVEFRAMRDHMAVTERSDGSILVRHDRAHAKGAALVPYPQYDTAGILSVRDDDGALDLDEVHAKIAAREAALQTRLERLRAVGA
jgi:HK97 family phage prohead protease